jgi:hypothetical protein
MTHFSPGPIPFFYGSLLVMYNRLLILPSLTYHEYNAATSSCVEVIYIRSFSRITADFFQ